MVVITTIITAIVAMIATVETTIIAITSYPVTVWATVVVDAVAALLRIAVATVGGGGLCPHWNEGESHYSCQKCILHQFTSYPVWVSWRSMISQSWWLACRS